MRVPELHRSPRFLSGLSGTWFCVSREPRLGLGTVGGYFCIHLGQSRFSLTRQLLRVPFTLWLLQLQFNLNPRGSFSSYHRSSRSPCLPMPLSLKYLLFFLVFRMHLWSTSCIQDVAYSRKTLARPWSSDAPTPQVSDCPLCLLP